MRSRAGVVLAAVALSLGLVLTTLGPEASATVYQRPPAGSPDPREMVLRASDLGPAARVTAQRYYRDTDFPSVISYLREFELARVGSTELIYVDSEVEVGRSAAATSRYLRTIRRAFGTKQGRALIVESFAEEFPPGGLVSNLRIGRPRDLRVGADSFDLLFTFRMLGARVAAHVAAFRVDRILGALVTVGEPGERVSLSSLARLARVMAARMGAELAPRSTGVPAISGTATVGQALTATRGTWRGTPTSFSFQWQRCDAIGLSCASIPGATGQRYVVDEVDVGSRIRVVVSARNPSGVGLARSAPTSVVPETAAPGNVSPPTVSGIPQVGQTLTAQGAGTWSGNPIDFAFRWLRCDAAGGACVDIPGATGTAYLVSGADVGSTIRLAVTARNSAGDTTAVSAPTPVVT